MTSPVLLFHTLRHLRPTQVVRRAYYGMADRFAGLSAWDHPLRLGNLGGCAWRPRGGFLPPPQGQTQRAIREGFFRFQNDQRQIGCPIDWNQNEAPLLWRYHLHYFDYLWSLDFDSGREIVRDWIDRHTMGRGQVGWAPYPTSLRLMNWCAYFFARHFEATQTDSPFREVLQASIASQVARLSRRLEYHLLGNHLLENAAALVLVGSCFDGPAARLWLETGLQLLRQQLPEQILADGMHFELSPMYHSRVLDRLLWLMNVVNDEVFQWLSGYVVKMLDALACTSHPDGGIALLNDSALGAYPALADLADFAKQLGVHWEWNTVEGGRTFALDQAGYYGARTRQGHYVVCDAGKVGPDYIPGHAHGDIFSFELSLFGDRIIVDSGVHDYVSGEMRRYCRSTAAHNTVEIGDQDQCEFWDAFKVARRGRPHDVRFVEEDWGFRLSGWHDGYRRLPGRPVHRREFLWRREGALVVRDTVGSSGTTSFVSRIHLHPSCHISERTETNLVVARGDRRYTVQFEGGQVHVGTHWYCPAFGRREKVSVIVLWHSQTQSGMTFSIAPSEVAVKVNWS